MLGRSSSPSGKDTGFILKGLLRRVNVVRNQSGALIALDALLLLGFPLLFTLQQLEELPPLAEESHQLEPVIEDNLNLCYLFCIILFAFLQSLRRFISFKVSSTVFLNLLISIGNVSAIYSIV